MSETQSIICQSCGMPMGKPEDFGTNADGSASAEYCRYCFQNGEFTAKMEMPEYIEMQVSPQHQSHLICFDNQ